MIRARSSVYDTMALCLSEKSSSLSLCSLSVQIRQTLRLRGSGSCVLWEHKAHWGPSETARQTPGFNPIKKPLLSPSIGSLRKAKSIKRWTRNQYLSHSCSTCWIFSSLGSADPHVALSVCVCPSACACVSLRTCVHACGCTPAIDPSDAARKKPSNYIKMTANLQTHN